jgi:hypothetical protein
MLQAADRLPHPLVTVSDSTSSFGSIAVGAQVQGDRFAFTLDPGADPATLLLRLTLTDALGPADVQILDVIPPGTPDSLTAFGSPTSIRVTWKRSPAVDTKGYDILRSSTPGGPFTRINSYTADGTAAFEDRGLVSLTRYYYQVVGRDSSYNASTTSAIVSGTTIRHTPRAGRSSRPQTNPPRAVERGRRRRTGSSPAPTTVRVAREWHRDPGRRRRPAHERPFAPTASTT